MLFQVLNSKFNIVRMLAVDVDHIAKFLRPITIVDDPGWLSKFLFLSIDEVVEFLYRFVLLFPVDLDFESALNVSLSCSANLLL